MYSGSGGLPPVGRVAVLRFRSGEVIPRCARPVLIRGVRSARAEPANAGAEQADVKDRFGCYIALMVLLSPIRLQSLPVKSPNPWRAPYEVIGVGIPLTNAADARQRCAT